MDFQQNNTMDLDLQDQDSQESTSPSSIFSTAILLAHIEASTISCPIACPQTNFVIAWVQHEKPDSDKNVMAQWRAAAKAFASNTVTTKLHCILSHSSMEPQVTDFSESEFSKCLPQIRTAYNIHPNTIFAIYTFKNAEDSYGAKMSLQYRKVCEHLCCDCPSIIAADLFPDDLQRGANDPHPIAKMLARKRAAEERKGKMMSSRLSRLRTPHGREQARDAILSMREATEISRLSLSRRQRNRVDHFHGSGVKMSYRDNSSRQKRDFRWISTFDDADVPQMSLQDQPPKSATNLTAAVSGLELSFQRLGVDNEFNGCTSSTEWEMRDEAAL